MGGSCPARISPGPGRAERIRSGFGGFDTKPQGRRSEAAGGRPSDAGWRKPEKGQGSITYQSGRTGPGSPAGNSEPVAVADPHFMRSTGERAQERRAPTSWAVGAVHEFGIGTKPALSGGPPTRHRVLHCNRSHPVRRVDPRFRLGLMGARAYAAWGSCIPGRRSGTRRAQGWCARSAASRSRAGGSGMRLSDAP